MNESARYWGWAGVSGVAGITCYLAFIFVRWPDTQAGLTMALAVAAAWPVLSIVYSHGLFRYVAAERDSPANALAFLFSVAAFTILLAMLIVQLAVESGLRDIMRDVEPETASLALRSLRMVDLGLDVTWDVLIGTALIFSGVAIRSCRRLGPAWGYPSALLGAALIALNAATFPWPSAGRGSFDIGPLVGLFVVALSSRLAWLGFRASGKTPAVM